MQFHPLAYMVKLNIEMSMADLIGKIASDRSCVIIGDETLSNLEWAGVESMREVRFVSIERTQVGGCTPSLCRSDI